MENDKKRLLFSSLKEKYNVNPFAFTFKEFVELPDKTRNDLVETASKINKEFTEKYFKEHPYIDWFVIAKKPENIIISGKSKNMPYEEDLMDLAKKINTPVFTYRRPIIIE